MTAPRAAPPSVAALTEARPFWTLDRIAEALRGRAVAALPRGGEAIRDICTDTRSIAAGDCFVALRGERFDAHDYLGEAVAAGAAALVVERRPATLDGAVPVYTVDDTLVALGDLARYLRTAWDRTVVAVAGSNGKTTTKELLRAALGAAMPVHATRGNLNNRVGVPLTILATPPDAAVAVVELGTNVPGEIALLRDIARPDITLVTSIAEEHLEGLGTLAGVLEEEASACDGVPLAIVPAAEEALAAAAASRARRTITAGLDRGDFRPGRWELHADGSGSIVVDGVEIASPLLGAHNLLNLTLAVAAANALGVPAAVVSRGMRRLEPPPMRAASLRIGAATVINDAYNANPGSARAALALLAAAPATQRVAVLGTMRELGPSAGRYHDEIARSALAAPIDVVAGVGDFAAALERVAPGDPRAVTAPDVPELWPRLEPRLRPDATILLKASRGMRLERLLSDISRWATPAC